MDQKESLQLRLFRAVIGNMPMIEIEGGTTDLRAEDVPEIEGWGRVRAGKRVLLLHPSIGGC